MPPAPVAGNEGRSAEAVAPESGSPEREPFDRLILLAAELLRAPMAAVTLCDAEGNLVDGSVGLVPPPPDAQQVTRPLCAELIRSGKLLVVRDVRHCPRYADHPEIIRQGVRAYVGIPLRLQDGEVHGSLCVLDRQPRGWSEQEVGILKGLAAAVTSEMSLRQEAHQASAGLCAAEHARVEAERARDRLEILVQASMTLAESLDFKTTLDNVVRLMVPLLADVCGVFQQSDDGRVARIAISSDPPGDRRRPLAGIASYDVYPADHPIGPASVARTGKTEVVDPVTDEWLQSLAMDDDHLAALRRTGWRKVIIAPLTLHGRTFGSLSCAHIFEGKEYTPEDRRVIEQLADRVAVALDNARLYRERDDVAQMLQRSLLPPALPPVPGMDHGLRYRPAQAEWLVCGDFYDLFQVAAGEWVAAIGDVCGKGLPAAALANLARHVIRTAAMDHSGPRDILRVLNDALLREETVPDDARSATALCLRVRPRPRDAVVVTLSSAGHPQPVVLRRHGGVEAVSCPGLLLGAFPTVDVMQARVALNPGDAIVMFTDGVTEARRGRRLFTTGRLRQVVARCRGFHAQAIADSVASAVTEWEDGNVRDDLAVFVLRNPL
ncbi:MAG: SpoIIE family protein phosphatase [Egibacteraceae bacterium]